MAPQTNLVVNCDDALLFWNLKVSIPDCLGFAIGRERKLPSGAIERSVLQNRMGFKNDNPKLGEHRPSTEWPFQRLWWTDHEVNLGDTVRYSVCPVVLKSGVLTPLQSDCSPWTPWRTLSGGKQDGYAAFFNRGLVISQFMARYLAQLRKTEKLSSTKDALTAFKRDLGQHELPIRKFLSGALRDEMLNLLASARKSKGEVFAALYELADDELLEALCTLGESAHVVLANGSITKTKDETTAEARKRDENKDARERLKKAGVEVHDRFLSPGALGHNKFLCVCDSTGKPRTVWTGSTNWTSTGLCTQTNNGLRVTDDGVANEYRKQWDLLRDAGSSFDPALMASNNVPKSVPTGASSADIWFTKTTGGLDLDALDTAIKGAKEGVLFLMFQPGGKAALKTIQDLAKARPELYVRGVVSTLPTAAESDESKVEIDVHTDSTSKSLKLDVVQPEGIHAFANWAAVVARKEFLTKQGGAIGFAIVHSKVIVIDPFSNPVVITGSHNFSGAASTKNDENFVIVRGNDELAASYAAHIMGIHDHYQWLKLVNKRQSQKGTKQLSGYLQTSDAWLGRKLKSAEREMAFWAR